MAELTGEFLSTLSFSTFPYLVSTSSLTSSSRSRCQLGSFSLNHGSISRQTMMITECHSRQRVKHVAQLHVLRLLNRNVRAHPIGREVSFLSCITGNQVAYTELGCWERLDTVGSG